MSETTKFQVDRSRITSLESDLLQSGLENSGIEVYSQESFERGVLAQVDEALEAQSSQKDIEPAKSRISQLEKLEKRTEIEENELKSLETFVISVEKEIEDLKNDHKRKLQDVIEEASCSLIRHGELTPFEVINKKQKVEETEDDEDEVETAKRSDTPDKEESDYVPSSNDEEITGSEDDGSEGEVEIKTKKVRKRSTAKKKQVHIRSQFRDDGSDTTFYKRIKQWKKERMERKLLKIQEAGIDTGDDFEEEIEVKGRFRVAADIWNKLYKYQKTGVRWLYELHTQAVGGIMGDEMGLGKTVQIIAFLAGLAQSKLPAKGFGFGGLGPVLIVSPTTVMHQWVREFHNWCPRFRIAILHQSGSHKGRRSRLVAKIATNQGYGQVLITSYSTLTQEKDILLDYDWHYVILDEGHTIRNPDAKMTVTAKEFRTPHRLILTGSPMQNSLRELWSLVDFVYPGRIGSLPVFMEQFSVPITQGGYANATQVQVRTAYKCACVLRDAIAPYLLRRMKNDVQMSVKLPSKSEQVLFCRITEHQRELYKDYLRSRECESILTGGIYAFVGLILLRKLCNHPDLVTGGPNRLGDLDEKSDPTLSSGHWSRSGKMLVVKELLKLWHRQQHKVLLFSQSRQMLCLMEKFVKNEHYSYLRMDGSTSISGRQPLVEKFNTDSSIFVFLLTTRVGGLGVNLTGADRVLIFDPDWNPSTDTQARERAWRIGQNRPVTIYRLLTSGTIEEKIYHRQIFKQFLTNRILKDPRQRRFFKTNDLYELFQLNDEKSDSMEGTETAALFAGTGSEIVPVRKTSKHKNFFDERAKDVVKEKLTTVTDDQEDVDYVPAEFLSPEKTEQLRKLAKKLSSKLSKVSKKSSVENKVKKTPICLFENEVEVPYLDKQTDFTPGEQEESKESRSEQQDDYVLSRLFKKSGVHSALKHDNIVSSSDPDYALVEEEASKVANRAAKALHESRRQLQLDRLASGKGPTKPRFGAVKKQNSQPKIDKKSKSIPKETDSTKTLFSGDVLFIHKSNSAPSLNQETDHSSQDLLAAIRSRKQNDLASDSSDDNDNEISTQTNSMPQQFNEANRYDHLAFDLRSFIALKDGKAKTADILEKFKDAIPRRDSSVFRALLRKFCDFQRDSDTSLGFWVLKRGYR